MNLEPLFAADSIGKAFGRRTILKSASVWAWPGRVTALLGRNGCGKSTLLKIGAGVMRADHGVVRYKGRSYEHASLATLARNGLYYLPDRGGIPLDKTLRVIMDVVAAHYGRPASCAAADALGLTRLLDTPVLELSGGELKRAEVAVAIARAPSCLIADEPLAGISPLDAEQICQAFRRLCVDGCAVIVSGHEVPSLLALADEVVWSTSGTTHALGSSAVAQSHDQFCREYLGVRPLPYPGAATA